MEKLVNKLATELAKYEFNELANLLSDMPFIKAYNTLKVLTLKWTNASAKVNWLVLV